MCKEAISNIRANSSTWFENTSPVGIAGLFALGLLCCLLNSTHALARNDIEDWDDTVLMLEVPSVTIHSAALVTAVRAQLAASTFVIKKAAIDTSHFDARNPLQSASSLALEYRSKMVFWIQIRSNDCTVSFYFDENPTQLYQRTLHLDSEDEATRYEVVANAVSSLIEDTVFNLQDDTQNKFTIPTQHTLETPSQAPTALTGTTGVHVSYRGSVFTHSRLTSGIAMGLNFQFTSRAAAGLGYTQGITSHWDTATYRFAIASRHLDVGIAGILYLGTTQIRIGLSYTLTLRALSMTSKSEELTVRPDRLSVLHGVIPNISIVWPLSVRFRFFTTLGAVIYVNEQHYFVASDDGAPYPVTTPYPAKFDFQLGFIFLLRRPAYK